MSEVPVTADDLVEITEPAPAARRRTFEYHVIVLIGSLTILALAATMSVQGGTQVTPPLFSQPLPELCHSRRFFGIDCPGCGMTRCFISLAHGDLAAAWRYNAAGILLFGMVVAQVPYRGLQLWRVARGQAEWYSQRFVTALSVVLVTMLMVQWVWKLFQMALG